MILFLIFPNKTTTLRAIEASGFYNILLTFWNILFTKCKQKMMFFGTFYKVKCDAKMSFCITFCKQNVQLLKHSKMQTIVKCSQMGVDAFDPR